MRPTFGYCFGYQGLSVLSVRLLDCIRNGPIQLSGSLSIPKMMRDGSRDCWFPDGWDEMNIITIDRDLLLAVPTHTINLALGCFTIITSSIGIGWCLQSIGKYTHIDGVSILFENWILTKLWASYRIYTFNCRHKVRRYIYIYRNRSSAPELYEQIHKRRKHMVFVSTIHTY